MRRVYLVHGWEGNPNNCWFPWLKNELKGRGFEVIIPAMPNPEEPEIGEWVAYLEEKVEKIDKNTYFIGHSIGCQAILRFLEKQDLECGGMILVAPWIKLRDELFEEEGEEVAEIARPWEETPINWKKIKGKVVCIFSDNDPDISVEENSKIFKEKLNAKIIIKHNKGHFNDTEKIKEILEFILK